MTGSVSLWLERLYGNSPGHFAITPFANGQPKKSTWVPTDKVAKAVRSIEQAGDRSDLYLSVCTHEAPQETRGGEETVISMPGLWADLDIGTEGHRPSADGLPNAPDEVAALSIIEGLPEPSMLLHSGGGLQALWLFEDGPWLLRTADDKTAAKAAMSDWADQLVERGSQRGFHVDRVDDLARILRVPGSFNRKTNTPRPVAVRWSDRAAHARSELVQVEEVPAVHTDAGTDDFGMTWDEILSPHGYQKCSETSWTRPGKKCSDGASLTIPPGAPYVITNWSETDTRLPVGKGTKLTKDKVYELLNDGNKPRPKRKLKLTRASSIEMEPIRWLWDGRIAVGTLALLAGREGIGKSTLAYTLAADITRGRLPGEYYGKPRSVIVVATEDSWKFTINPRLVAAGADLDRVYQVEAADPNEYGVSLPRDLDELSEAAKEVDTGLILLDPLMSRLGDLDTHKDSEVRKALEPLVKMAEEAGAAVLGLIHVNKSGSSDALTSMMGSRAFSAVSRAVLFVAEDPDDHNVKMMGQPKNNLGVSDLPELTYTLSQVMVKEVAGRPITSVQLKWGEERAPGTLREVLATRTHVTQVGSAVDWLRGYLTENGSSPSKEVREAGAEMGYSPSTLLRALGKLGGKTKRGGMPASTHWELPGNDIITPA